MGEYERERRVREIQEGDPERTRPLVPERRSRRVEEDIVERDDSSLDDRYRRQVLYNKIANVVWTITGFIEALIGLRVLLRLIAANPNNPFVDFIYDLSWIFVSPFVGIVGDPQADGAVLEINSLLAMLIYLLLAYGILRLISLILTVTAPAD